ncbi:MAG: CAP domain-containing protein [Actinobacteria bacterium]|nr:CAP domain-containing protein [Actinomycetota bacterium]
MKTRLKSLLVFLSAIVIAVSIVLTTACIAGQLSSIDVLGKTATDVSNNTNTVTLKEAPLNDYENAIASLINNVRVENGLNALAADGSLTEIAKARSQDMMDRNYFSHYTPEGTTVFNLLKGNGIGYRYAGENLAQSAPASVGTPEGFLNAWLNSPSHRDNMLRSQYTKIGVGMIETDSRRIVTTVFIN